jgi:hypothetical protein
VEGAMTHFLKSDDNPDGYRLEDILRVIRKDVIHRCTKIMDDPSPTAHTIMNNNMQILNLLTNAIDLAESSSNALTREFGPPHPDGTPRIGER